MQTPFASLFYAFTNPQSGHLFAINVIILLVSCHTRILDFFRDEEDRVLSGLFAPAKSRV
jgi:hypothetical protein